MRFSVGASALAAFVGLAAPVSAATNSTINSQIRLAYAGDTGMFVSWNTFSQLSKPTVHYGVSSNALTETASSNVSVTYRTSLTYNNHVKIGGLKPNAMYYYLPEHLLNTNNTTPYSFKTSRPAGDGESYTAAVVVDLGTMGPQGLTTTAGKGVSPNNTLAVGETNTVESLTQQVNTFDFLWHRMCLSTLSLAWVLIANTRKLVILHMPTTGSRRRYKASYLIQPSRMATLSTNQSSTISTTR